MKVHILLVILWLSEFYCHQTQRNAVTEQFYWDNIDFEFPNATARQMALCTGSYIPGKSNIWGIEIWKDKVFVSLFRLGLGVATSLGYFPMNSTTKSPLVIPYPSFDANYVSEYPMQKTTLPSNSSVICAGYFRIDKCDRLWVVDAGVVDFWGHPRQMTPPALVIFDLNTNSLIRRYTIPAELLNSFSLFINLDIDFKGTGCDDAFAYMADAFRTIVVYSLKKDRSWRLVHNFFGSNPHAGRFDLEGKNVIWNFGVLAITIGEHHSDGSRRVYINPFSSTKSCYVSNKVLQNESYIALNNYFYDVHQLGDRGQNGQTFTWAYDHITNVIFDTQFYRHRIGCWNTANRYRNSSFDTIYKNKRLFFPADVKIDRKRNVWLLSNSLLTFLNGTWYAGDKNIRIFNAKVDDVISGTVCSKHN